MRLERTCFKVDKPNAKAMIRGFTKGGEIHHQCIWLAVKSLPFPALVTMQRSPTPFQLSALGRAMNPEDFTMTLKYAATLVSEYFVRNDLELWETICSNGLFDIWHPSAPHQRFAQADSHPANFRILLLRIYEIDHEFGPSDITHASSRIDHLASPIRDVGTKAPLISDERFDGVRGLLERSVKPYLTCPLPPKSSTTMDGQPFPDPAIAEHGKTTGDILLPQDKNPSGVVVAFEMLLGEIESEIDLLSRAGAAAFERRDYGSVQKALERVSELTALRAKVDRLVRERTNAG